jgi:hypothetical protein
MAHDVKRIRLGVGLRLRGYLNARSRLGKVCDPRSDWTTPCDREERSGLENAWAASRPAIGHSERRIFSATCFLSQKVKKVRWFVKIVP